MPYVDITPAEPGVGFVMPMMDVSKITRKWLDVDYTPDNPHPARKLDVFLPETGDGPFPTLVCIHGGGFTGGNKRDMQTGAYMEAIPYGFAVASVEQRLCNVLPEGGHNTEGCFPNPVFDYKAAIRYLRQNAAEYKLDPDRFALCGGSAGGYHVVMAAASADNEVLYDNSLGFKEVSGKAQAVVSWYPVGDLVTQSEHSEQHSTIEMPDGTKFTFGNIANVYLGVNVCENTNLAYFAAPESWITKEMPPTLIQAGAADMIVPIACARGIAAKIREVCGEMRVVYEEFPDYMHGDARLSDETNMARVVKWLQSVML